MIKAWETLVGSVGWPSLSDKRLNSRLRIFEKQLLDVWLVNTDDLVQPSRQNRHSDPDLSYTTLAAHTDVYKCSFSQEQYVIGTPVQAHSTTSIVDISCR